MPNQKTRFRRRRLGLPTNVLTIPTKEYDNPLMISRIGTKDCSSRFLVLGNCPDVIMNWIGTFIGGTTGFRLQPPYDSFTVWLFHRVSDASDGVSIFRSRFQMQKDRFCSEKMWNYLVKNLQLFELCMSSVPKELLRFP